MVKRSTLSLSLSLSSRGIIPEHSLKGYHLFPQESQSSVEVGRLVGQQAVGVVPAAAQVVLDHGLLHVHPLHVPPGAAARVQQAAQALRQRGETLDTGHSTRRTVRRLTVHCPRGSLLAEKADVLFVCVCVHWS